MSRWWNRAMAKAYGVFPALARRWGRKSPPTGGEIPWTPWTKALADSTWALVTTGGVHRADDVPFDMRDPDGDPSWRELPADDAPVPLRITHDYYDHADAERDVNLVFPAERLRELARRGVIGALSPVAYGLMGHVDGRHLATLVNVTAPEIARRIREAGIDGVLLVPA